MAENLVAKALHTKSKYAESVGELYLNKRQGLFSVMKDNSNFNDQIRNLETREQNYYAAADASTYEGFRKNIQEVISKDVARGLSQLGGKKLRDNLEKLRLQNLDETLTTAQDYEIIINTYGLQKATAGINKTLEELAEALKDTKDVKVTRQKGGRLKINLKPDARIMTKILNELGEVLKDEKTGKTTRKKGRKLKEDGSVTDSFLRRLTRLQDEGFLEFSPEGKTDTRFSEIFRVEEKYLGYPWNFRKGDVDMALLQDNESIFRQRLVKALRDIHAWLSLQIGPDLDLQASLTEEWNKIVGENESDLTNASFFLKGGYIELVVGAMGEFQTAVFQNYLGRKFPKMKANFSANIQGNVFGEGTSEQAKADVLFGKLGIQVKNYSSTQSRIEGNIHPWELTSYYDQNELFESGFFGLLANRFWIEFNGPSVADIAADLNDALSAILNFDTLTDDLEDKISFYMIGGCYLVPASVILKHYTDIQKGNRSFIDITSKAKPQPEDSFEDKAYWEHNGTNWVPTEKNTKAFDNLLKHSISFRATFNYGNIPNLEQYRLW